jgi:alpha-tubulin suppressor-like RCC1 family protein
MLLFWVAAGPAWAQQTTGSAASNEALAEPEGGTSSHKLVLCTDGTVMGWGYNPNGELGSNSSSGATPTVIPWSNQPVIVRVANASGTSFAIDAAGNLWAWGSNANGQLGLGSSVTSTPTPTQVPGIANVVSVCGGFFHTLALCADGTVWSWGQRAGGALGTGAAGAATVYLPQQIPAASFSGVALRAIASGDQFSMALDANGHIWSWGDNGSGVLGIAAPQGSPSQYAPTQITALNNVRQIEAGNVRAAALLTNGTVYNWGQNAGGQLGQGNTAYTSSPVQVGSGILTDIVWIALNTGATIAVHPNGATHVWGNNSYGELGVTTPSFAYSPISGPTFSANVQISGLSFQFTSIERTGTVKTWGSSPLGYTPSGAGAAPNGGSYTPTTPTSVCLAVPSADFPPCGLPQRRAFFQRPAATYVAAQHGYTVSPAEIGSYAQLTTIDASLAPYNGTVVFDGIYHLRGDVRVINGTFVTNNGTTFYIDGQSGRPTDSGLSSIEVNNADLRLSNTTLQAQCGMWQGIWLPPTGQIHTFNGGKPERRCAIRDASYAIGVAAGAHYYLTSTDFINNWVGIQDVPRTNLLAGEGVQNCTFRIDATTASPLVNSGFGLYSSFGIAFNAVNDTSPNNQYSYFGDFGNATFANNTFDRLKVGIEGTAGNANFSANTFTNCWYAAARSYAIPNASTSVPVTAPMRFTGNTIRIPANFPADYTTTANTTAYGIWAQQGHELQNNTINRATAITGVAARQVGAALRYKGVVQGNTFTNLRVGVEVTTGDWYQGTDYTITSNTFTGPTAAVSEGVSFLYPGYNIGYPSLSVALRCNSFAATVSGSTGVWVKANAVFPGALGSASLPNGNNFSGIADATKRFVFDPTSTTFVYYRYTSQQEALGGSLGNTISAYNGGSVATVNNSTTVPSSGACGTSSATPGVYARPAAGGGQTASSNGLAPELRAAYPNPASDAVTLSYYLQNSTTTGRVLLRDLLGQTVGSALIKSETGAVQLSVASLPAGFYTAVLELDGRVVATQKLTVQH